MSAVFLVSLAGSEEERSKVETVEGKILSRLTRLSWFEVLMWCVEGALVLVCVPASHDW